MVPDIDINLVNISLFMEMEGSGPNNPKFFLDRSALFTGALSCLWWWKYSISACINIVATGHTCGHWNCEIWPILTESVILILLHFNELKYKPSVATSYGADSSFWTFWKGTFFFLRITFLITLAVTDSKSERTFSDCVLTYVKGRDPEVYWLAGATSLCF